MNEMINVVCKFYMNGNCNRSNCKFIHDDELCKKCYHSKCNLADCRQKYDKLISKYDTKKKHFKKSYIDMNVRLIHRPMEFPRFLKHNDVCIGVNLFNDYNPQELFDNIMREIPAESRMRWHKDSHFIVDDKKTPQFMSPTFAMIVDRMCAELNIKPVTTRLNMYTSSDWKPFHRDAAAFRPEAKKLQDVTVALNLGESRDICFQHSKKKTKVNFQLEDGMFYTFGKNVNINWKHGVPKLNPDETTTSGKITRISVVVWGKVMKQVAMLK